MDVYLKSNCKSKFLRISFIRKQNHALLKFGLNRTMCHTPTYVSYIKKKHIKIKIGQLQIRKVISSFQTFSKILTFSKKLFGSDY